MQPDDLSDQAAKVDTWKNIEQRATGGSEYTCGNCHHCNLRYQAWLEFHYLFQILMRNKERLQPEKDAGPKVDAIIRERVQRAKAHGWKGLVEEYLADAALRLKSDLDRGQPAPTARLLGEPPSSQDADAFCRNAITMQSGASARNHGGSFTA